MRTIFNKQLIVPLIFMLFGLLFFAIGSGMTIRQRTLEGRGVETQGMVVGLQENYDSDGSTYAPVVQFRTDDGQSVEFVSAYSSSPPAHKVGETVIVVYPSDDPANAVIKGDGQLLHIIFMLVGGVAAFVGFSMVFSIFRASMISNPGEL